MTRKNKIVQLCTNAFVFHPDITSPEYSGVTPRQYLVQNKITFWSGQDYA